jgi:protein-S-isoprenylcysteine O-methyltransferase Ste14
MALSRNAGLNEADRGTAAVDDVRARGARRSASVAVDHATALTQLQESADRRRVVGGGHVARARPRPAVRVTAAPVSAAERTRAAQIGAWLFRYRGVLPIPVLLVPLCVRGSMTATSWAAGLAMVAVGELLRLAGVAAAGPATRRRTRCVPHLVTDGPFAWARNPIYIGNALVWTGVAIVTGVHWYLPIAVLAFAVEYGFIVRYEEGVLESTFGAAYLAYKGRTPRWLPRRPALGPRPVGRRYDWGAACRSETSTLANCAAALGVVAMKGLIGG